MSWQPFPNPTGNPKMNDYLWGNGAPGPNYDPGGRYNGVQLWKPSAGNTAQQASETLFFQPSGYTNAGRLNGQQIFKSSAGLSPSPNNAGDTNHNTSPQPDDNTGSTSMWGGTGQTSNPSSGTNFRTNIYGSNGSATNYSGANFADADSYGDYYMRPLLNQGLSYLEQGVGFTPFEGDRVANLTGDQTNILNQIINRGSSPSTAMNNAYSGMGSIANNGGLTGAMNSSLSELAKIQSGQTGITDRYAGLNPGGYGLSTARDGMNALTSGTNGMMNSAGNVFSNAASGGMNTSTANHQNLVNNAAGPSYTETNLQDIAAGKELGTNPYAKQALDAQLAEIQNSINSQFAGGGRTSSGAHQGNLARDMTNAASSHLMQNYENERNRQMQANSMLDSARQGNLNTQMNAANALSALQGQNTDRQLGAAGQQAALGQNIFNNQMGANQGLAQTSQQIMNNRLAGIEGSTGVESQNIANRANAANSALGSRLTAQSQGMQAAGMLPGLDNAMFNRMQQGLNAATIFQGQNQDEINAQMAAHDENQQAPWQRLGAYGGLLGQTPFSPSSSTAQVSQQQQPSTLESILGGAAMGSSIGGSFGMGGLGALAGGVLGGFF